MAAPFRVGEELELRIDSLAFGGRGVRAVDDFVLFVDRALPGDRVRARVTKVKRRHGEAVAVETLERGPDRVDAPCPHFGAVRRLPLAGPRLRARSCEHKTAQVRDALERIGHQSGFELRPDRAGARRIYGYRNKLEFSCRADRRRARRSGFHRGRPLGRDPAGHRLPADRRGRQRGARGVSRRWARRPAPTPYDQRTGTGLPAPPRRPRAAAAPASCC